MAKLSDWLLKHKAVAIFLVLWGLTLFTVVTLKVFFDPPTIPGGTAGAYATFFAILGVALTPWEKIAHWAKEKASVRGRSKTD